MRLDSPICLSFQQNKKRFLQYVYNYYAYYSLFPLMHHAFSFQLIHPHFLLQSFPVVSRHFSIQTPSCLYRHMNMSAGLCTVALAHYCRVHS